MGLEAGGQDRIDRGARGGGRIGRTAGAETTGTPDLRPTTPLGPRMPALRNGVAVLRQIASSSTPVPAAAISRQLGIPRSSAYQTLQVLMDEGLVVHIPADQGYKLGVGLFELGSAYMRHQPLEHLARPVLARLVRKIGVTAHLGILHGCESLYLLKEQVPGQVKLVTDVGVRLPAHLTATGRSMLALLPSEQVSALFPTRDRFVDRTGRGARGLGELRAVLAADRERGWSLEEGAVSEGVTCVAAACTDHAGFPVASVSVSFLGRQASADDVTAIVRQVRAAADSLTKQLGGRR